jgi:predicted metal-binding protein
MTADRRTSIVSLDYFEHMHNISGRDGSMNSSIRPAAPVEKGALMQSPVRLGIIICDRYRSCAAGKCLRALRSREGAFSVYEGRDVELVGITTCGGCPGGNVEYAPEEMIRNGATVIHLATGFVVGYPPCPHLDHFLRFIPEKHGVAVVVGTHPIPQNYLDTHRQCGTWDDEKWNALLAPTLADEAVRRAYD